MVFDRVSEVGKAVSGLEYGPESGCCDLYRPNLKSPAHRLQPGNHPGCPVGATDCQVGCVEAGLRL